MPAVKRRPDHIYVASPHNTQFKTPVFDVKEREEKGV
jgi:hypothetical protein